MGSGQSCLWGRKRDERKDGSLSVYAHLLLRLLTSTTWKERKETMVTVSRQIFYCTSNQKLTPFPALVLASMINPFYPEKILNDHAWPKGWKTTPFGQQPDAHAVRTIRVVPWLADWGNQNHSFIFISSSSFHCLAPIPSDYLVTSDVWKSGKWKKRRLSFFFLLFLFLCFLFGRDTNTQIGLKQQKNNTLHRSSQLRRSAWVQFVRYGNSILQGWESTDQGYRGWETEREIERDKRSESKE